MEAEKIDTLTFKSPLNLEGSWGMRSLSAETESVMELYFYKDNSGFIDWINDEFDMSEHIGVWFEIDRNGKRTLTDYDGVFTLPDQAMDLLEKNGVDCAEMRKSLAD